MRQKVEAEFPKRVKQHISETRSAQLLRANLPRDWIVRDLSERDYGLDVLIEITHKGRLTGNMVAGQLKSIESFQFPKREKQKSFKGMRRSTYNYLLNLPTPAFIFVCSLSDQRIYWRSLREVDRESSALGAGSLNIVMHQDYDLSQAGRLVLTLSSLLESRWPDVERAVLGALMFYNALGPLFLACKREEQTKPAPLAVHLLLLQHYEYNTLICRYVLHRTVKRFPPLPGAYWSKKYPYVMMHLSAYPPYFLDDDWYPRYYWDEYKSETKHINLDMFADIDEDTRSTFAEFMKLR